MCLNLFVPEFDDYPQFTKQMIVTHASYREFEPGRVILRQGHTAENFYIILFGNALVIEARPKENEPIEIKFFITDTLKRGDYFGEHAIINKSQQPASVYASGESHIILLCMNKKLFYRIQSTSSDADNMAFMKEKLDILKSIDYPFDLFDTVNNHKNAYFSFFYRPG